jgi:hypothetical protein
MILSIVTNLRLHNQQLTHLAFTKPAELVAWMGILQAQDYASAKWSIGLRLPNITDAGVEKAIADKNIVRSWSLRGTLHFMAPDNLYHYNSIIGPRLIASMAGRHKQLGLDNATLAKGQKVLEKAMQGGKQLTRDELRQVLQAKSIPNEGLQLNHIMLCTALNNKLCLSNRRNKEFTYTLQEEWIPKPKALKRDEVLALMAKTYFQSHAPATVADFAWWAGITLADAKIGFEAVKSTLVSETIDGIVYWMPKSMPDLKGTSSLLMLPAFDEYLLGYKDRNLMLPKEHLHHVIGSGNGLFAPVILKNGMAQGVWRRTIKNGRVVIELNPFTKFSGATRKDIVKEAAKFATFIDMELSI